MRGNLNETFKIIDEIFNYGKHFIFLLELEIYFEDRFQKVTNWNILLIE